jgi:hypothetical protein
VGDERAERLERDSHWHAAIVEGHAGQWKFTSERGALQPLQAGRVLRPHPECALVRRLEPRLEHADERRTGPVVHANRRKGVGGAVPLRGPIEDFPVTELTSATKPDAARANAAKRE